MEQTLSWPAPRGARTARWLQPLLGVLAASVLFGALAYLSIELTREEGRIAAVWLPNALAVALLLRLRLDWRHEAALLGSLWLANLLANLASHDAVLRAGALATSNTAEIIVALALVRRFCSPRPDMQDIDDLTRFVLLAGLCAPAVSGCIAMIGLSFDGNFSWQSWLQWGLTDAMGMIIIAPCAMIVGDAVARHRRPSRRESVEWLVLTAGGTSLTFAVFNQTHYPLLFLVAPVVVSHAFRLGSLGTAFSLAKVAVIATILTWYGRGPINLIDSSMAPKILTLQAFLASAFIIGMPVAAILNGRKRMLEDIAEREGQLSLLADNITDAVLRYDLTGCCTYASPSVAEVLGAAPATFIGSRASQRMHPEAAEAIAGAEARLLSGDSEKERISYRRYLDDAAGNPVYIEADCALARNSASGAAGAIIVSARNVTQRVELERKLTRARQHAEDAAIAKSQFLANMSHEIRTPMNGVLGFTDLLLTSPLSPEQRRQAELIDESGKSMMRLLNDILDISKIEAGQIRINPEPMELRHVLEGCVHLHSANAAKKGLSLMLDIHAALPVTLECDSLRLRQIVLNLIGNAIKFTEAGSVTLRARGDGRALVIEVADSGIGIAADRIDSIFQPFEQADNATSRNYGGTGLGLAISRQLAGLLGGRLSATSTEGAGSCFALRLPLIVPEDGDTSAPEQVFDPAIAGLPPPCRVLLVEDHDINRILFTAMLQKCGQQIDTAEDGELAIAAVKAARAQGRPYDLVLMDVQMPRCDGYSATRRLREAGITPQELPIIALTANAYPEDIAAALNAGMQAHLPKPLETEKLANALHQWLPRRADSHTAPPPPMDMAKSPCGPGLMERWQARRSEALAAVAAAVRTNALAGAETQQLAALVHKLAGTAGMFGEAELGSHAAVLERALVDDTQAAARPALARRLLDLAQAA